MIITEVLNLNNYITPVVDIHIGKSLSPME
jgi:hypothetical protein